MQEPEFLDSNQSGRRCRYKSKHMLEREIGMVLWASHWQNVFVHMGKKKCLLVVVASHRIFCAGLLSGRVPAGQVLPGGHHHWLSALQEARGHLGTLHQRVCLLPGSAHGSQRGNCVHNASECTNKPTDHTQTCCFSSCHRCLCESLFGISF